MKQYFQDKKAKEGFLLFILKHALQEFYSSGDANDLLKNEDDDPWVAEQTSAFRLGYYIQLQLNQCIECEYFRKVFDISDVDSSKIVVDAEYNKHSQHGKEVYRACKNCKENECFVRKCKTTFSVRLKIEKAYSRKKRLLSTFVLDTSRDKTMRPDLLIHSRGNDNFNLMAIEIKKGNVGTSEIQNYGEDFAKLAYLTCPNSEMVGTKYEYVIGVFLELSASRSNSKELKFIEGQIEGQKDRLTSEGKIEKLPDSF